MVIPPIKVNSGAGKAVWRRRFPNYSWTISLYPYPVNRRILFLAVKETLDTEADLLQKWSRQQYKLINTLKLETFILNHNSDIPSLGQLALKYGTLNQGQLDHAEALLKKRASLKQTSSLTQILLGENLVTPSQISLLELILEFLIIRKAGEQFGQIAVEKGYTTQNEIKKALEKQKEEFRQTKLKRMIGDILVESGSITPVQRKIIATEQKRLEEAIAATFAEPEQEPDSSGQPTETPTDTAELSMDEKAFLKIKALDRQFGIRVVEKGYASQSEVDHAVKLQELKFKNSLKTTLLGEILVSEGILTPEQKNDILAEQDRLRDSEAQKTAPAHKPLDDAPDAKQDAIPDERIRIEVIKDEMEAVIHLAATRENPVCLDEIAAMMKNRGIRYGIFTPALLQCHLEKNDAKFIAARGLLPAFSGAEVAHYSTGIFTKPATPGRSGYGEATLKKGEPLAVIRTLDKDIPGKNIFGKPITKQLPGITPRSAFYCGQGVRLSKEKNRALAGRSGIPHRCIDGSLFVFSAVNILEDANLRFGPLEPFSDVNVAGILTDAYPVTAGRVRAREIRGTRLEALGDIHVTIGITDARIKTQGSVQARYIHNSSIEAYGDVIVDHEILDSTIIISGTCKAKKSRIIASTISAKKGIQAAGSGSDVTEPCTLSAGREDHILLENGRINTEIEEIRKELDDLKEQKESLEKKGSQLFDKMIKLKLFHDRAKQKKESVTTLLSKKGSVKNHQEQQKTERLLEDLNKKISSTISLLRDINKRNKSTQSEKKKVITKITALEPKVEKAVTALERERISILEWAQKEPGVPEILISGRVAQYTVFKGVYSSYTATGELNRVTISEQASPTNLSGTVMTITALGDR